MPWFMPAVAALGSMLGIGGAGAGLGATGAALGTGATGAALGSGATGAALGTGAGLGAGAGTAAGAATPALVGAGTTAAAPSTAGLVGQSFLGSALPGAMGKAVAPISWSAGQAPLTSSQLLAPIGSAASPYTAAAKMPLSAMGYGSSAGRMVKDVAGQALMQRMQDNNQPTQQPPMQMPQSPQLAGAAPPPALGSSRGPAPANDYESMISQLLSRYS